MGHMNGVCFSAGLLPLTPSDSYISTSTWPVLTTPATIWFFTSHQYCCTENLQDYSSTMVENSVDLYFSHSTTFFSLFSSSAPLPDSPLNAAFTKKKPIHPQKKGQHSCGHMIIHFLLTGCSHEIKKKQLKKKL